MSLDDSANPLLAETEVEDCGDPSCFGIHGMGRLPKEERATWVGRVTAMVTPRLDAVPVASDRPAVVSLLVDCDRCGEPRFRGYPCDPCRTARQAHRRLWG